MSRLMALIVKEFLALLKDPKSRFVIIGPPIVQLVVFGYAATFDLTNVPLAVHDESNSEPSRELVARFDGSPNFQRLATITHDDQISQLIDTKKVLVVLHIGRQFSRDLGMGKTTDVQVIVDGRDSNTAMIATGYAQTIIQNFNLQWAHRNGLPVPASSLEVRVWFNPNLVNMSLLVQKLTYLNPMRYFMTILRGVFLEGAPLELLVDQFWPMAVVGIMTLGAAASLFRQRMY